MCELWIREWLPSPHGILEEDDQVYLVALQVHVEEGDGNCVNSQLPFG